jgi:aminopeptidase N
MNEPSAVDCLRARGVRAAALFLLALLLFVATGRADEPYARSRDYDLQHSRISLRFRLSERELIGDVTHTLSILREGITELPFDSVGLSIETVSLNGKPARFETTDDLLRVQLERPARLGEKFEVAIHYTGKPKKGLYFILPDKNYPDRPKQIWTQGESEDTRYYIPIYDYPNDRLTTEMIATVPKDWITVSNGKLVSVTDAPDGQKTWHWSESVLSSTYLITLVAGEFDEVKDTWRGIPVTYYAPRGRGDRLRPNFGRTPQMMEFFSKRLGVNYPWEKYAQSMVDDFVAEGMENSSATTNASSSLTDVRLVPEYLMGPDGLNSHELGHQWFGDLVTCKDWGNVWLNEGFATYLQMAWIEEHYGKDQADYERWENAREWFGEEQLFGLPIVRHNFTDSSEFDGNAYTKGGWVLYMLRQQLGEQLFYRGLKHYLEKYRGQNVVTADFAKAMEEATATNIDRFLSQWVYGAGAPRFDLRYSYDVASRQVKLDVKQTQKVEDRVGIFQVPVEVEITTSSGRKSFPVVVRKDNETFTFPVDGPPLMVLFDKGMKVFKMPEFHKDKKEWLYQLQNAATVPDRADAAQALGKIKNDDEIVAALGEAARKDPFWGVRAEAVRALGQIGTPSAAKEVLAALANKEPWLRAVVVNQLGNFKDDAAVAEKLEAIARSDQSFRARANAVQAIGKLKVANALSLLQEAARSESPDDIVANAALRAMGPLGDEKAVPILLEASAPGNPIPARQAAISSLARIQKGNKEITRRMTEYLREPYFPIQLSTVFALGERGDKDAIPPLEALLKSGDLSIAFAPYIESQIQRLKKAGEKKGEAAEEKEGQDTDLKALARRLEKMEKALVEMNERLKTIESRLPPEKN